MIEALISGGQTGADQGGLAAAVELLISTGGYAPKGWKTESGPNPQLETLGLVEADTDDYLIRTKLNVKIADATIIFGKRSSGSNKTEEFCRVINKPCCWVLWPDLDSVKHIAFTNPARTYVVSSDNVRCVRLWIKRNNPKILNIAGNRESKNPGIFEFTKQFLIKALKETL